MTNKNSSNPSQFTPEELAEHKRDHALIEAVTKGDLDGVKQCHQDGACLDGYYGETWESLLHLAVREDHINIAAYLLDNGADLEFAENGTGRTPLFRTNKPEMARFLACRGANLEHSDDIGETVLGYGLAKLYPETAQAMQEGHALFEQAQLRANLPSVADEMQAQGLKQSRGRRL